MQDHKLVWAHAVLKIVFCLGDACIRNGIAPSDQCSLSYVLFVPAGCFELLCNLRSDWQSPPLQRVDMERISAQYTSFNCHLCFSFYSNSASSGNIFPCWSHRELLFLPFRWQQTLKIANGECFHYCALEGPAFDCGPWCAVVWKQFALKDLKAAENDCWRCVITRFQ